jgi:hypothetical protein
MSDENPATDQPDKLLDGRPETQTYEPGGSPTAQPNSADEFQNVKKELSGYERSTVWLTIVIGAVNAFTCLFIGLQWHEMKSGSADTHTLAQAANIEAGKMSDVSTAADKIRQAAQDMVTQDQRIADNAQRALDASIALAHNEQRAWIIVPHKYGLVDFAANGPITYSVGFLNTGKTPAQAVQAIVRAEIVGSRNEPSLSYESGTSSIFRSGELVPNDDEPPQRLQARAEHMPIIVSAERLRRIQSGGEYVAIYEQVIYKDIAGDHWMRFCTEVNTAEPLEEQQAPQKCEQYNSSGDGKSPPIFR